MGLFSKLRGLFRGRPKAPALPRKGSVRGHRGIAIGSSKPGQQDYSPENVAQWETISEDVVQQFVYEGKPIAVHSTNVSILQYFIDQKALLITFKKGKHRRYRYENVSEQEAINFMTATSKGSEVWDTLRIRGTKYGHRKPYRPV